MAKNEWRGANGDRAVENALKPKLPEEPVA